MKRLDQVTPYEATTINVIWPWEYIWGKRWTLICGSCWHGWRTRLQVATKVSVICPSCGVRNIITVSIGKVGDKHRGR